MVVSDPGHRQGRAHGQRGSTSLAKAGIEAQLFDGVHENPTTDDVEAGASRLPDAISPS